jgi:hypothetical protein
MVSTTPGVPLAQLKIAKDALVKKGFLPIPAHLNEKRPACKWRSEEYTIAKWPVGIKCIQGDRANVGVLTGEQSNIIVVDIDNKPPAVKYDNQAPFYRETTGLQDWMELCSQNGGEPNTLVAISPSGGYHYYFTYDAAFAAELPTTATCAMSVNGLLSAIDTRGDGGFIMTPPSATSAGMYSWRGSSKIKDTPIAEVPEWIKENIRATSAGRNKKSHDTDMEQTHRTYQNDAPLPGDFALFKESPYYKMHEVYSTDRFGRIIMKETADFDCEVCSRQHVRHRNHPFLVRKGDDLLFICRRSVGDRKFVRTITTTAEAPGKRKGDDTPTPHFLLMSIIWEYAKERSLKKKGEMIYKPVEDKPCAYVPWLEFNAFINLVLKGNRTFLSGPKRFKDITEHLKLYDDDDLPVMTIDEDYLAFRNGVLCITDLQFYDYSHQCLKDIVARHFIDVPFDGSTVTPVFDKLMEHQLPVDEIPEERKRIYDTILGLLGRLFFKTNRFDRFSVAPFLYGDTNCGKSTLLNIVKAWFPATGIAVMSSNSEKQYALHNLIDNDVVLIPDMPHNFHEIIDPTLIQNMIDGDHVNIVGKHAHARTAVFDVPLLTAGNMFPQFRDKKGAVVRRFAIFMFTNYINERDDSMLDRILANELPAVILKALQAYWKLVEEVRGKSFWDIVPNYFTENKEEIARPATNWLHRFLTADPDENKSKTSRFYAMKKVIDGEGRLRCSIQDVRKMFQRWVQFNHPEENVKWEENDYTTFRMLGYEIERQNMCKSCKGKAKGGQEPCCAEYSTANRSKRVYILDLLLVQENIPQPPII